MIVRRILAVLLLAYLFGFVAYMLMLARPVEGVTTDAIVVPTGGSGRIDRGIQLLQNHQAKRLLISGVAPGVSSGQLAQQYRVSPALFACCIDLGREAVDTTSNARETAHWVEQHGYRSVRLVTSDWHMARARMELHAALDTDVALVADGVPAEAPLGLLVIEYNKLLLRRVALWTGIGA
ncbi:MAG: YdcF family protein [Sphingomonas sp.]|uniref:YdcF family protein n=1 Tax=Sphingomonas sp. TaxID=28214 RepID=UPI001ACDE165|nr:YdcF family protein [Sphingomonas sp.]MBN8808663.1 YdcF family protein [Sphingomonas sp.]